MKKEAEELFIQDPVARNRTGRINYNKKKESYLLLYYKGLDTKVWTREPPYVNLKRNLSIALDHPMVPNVYRWT